MDQYAIQIEDHRNLPVSLRTHGDEVSTVEALVFSGGIAAYMAVRKMTITLPEDLAVRFLKRVPARDRSKYLGQALADKLVERERELIQACDVANRSQEVQAIEQEFDSLPDDVTEPWSNAPSR
jgi:hypothetical protein